MLPDAVASLRRFGEVRMQTARLAAPLSAEDCALQSMPDASPVKWHLAHTSWFFETFLLRAHFAGYRELDQTYRSLFNSYYVQVGARHARPERGLISRPGLQEVLEYRAHVEAHMERWLSSRPAPALLDLFELGLHHEQQHQELILTDLKHLFSRNPRRPAYLPAMHWEAGRTPSLEWHRHAEGVRETGHAGAGFCFDNERPRHRVFLESFEMASRPVTNREYLAFMDEDGYEQPQHWLSDGWDARNLHEWRAPLYWERQDGRWQYFTLAGMRPVDLDAPVCHVSYYEADAYARWANARLPTESEWEAVASVNPVEGNFADSGYLQPIPGCGRAQWFGDVWEWTASAYLAYPGYSPPAGAVGEYNGKFMVNQFVLRGGSCATPRSHMRPGYRNFFPPAARWQFSGIRLARSAP